MARRSAADMSFCKVYSALIQMENRKGRTRTEVYEVTSWLTDYSVAQIGAAMESGITYREFFRQAPAYNPR